MAIALPDFKNPHFFWVTACGEIPGADKELIKWLKAEGDKLAPFRTSRGTGRIRLMTGGKYGNHVHFDVYAPRLAAKKIGEDVKSTATQIQETASKLYGNLVETNLRGGFRAKLDELPESGIIRSLLFESKMGNVAIKLEGASFAIDGAPVQSISWKSFKDGTINVTIESELIKTTISDDYLVSAAKTLEEAFNIFVLGKVHNESK